MVLMVFAAVLNLSYDLFIVVGLCFLWVLSDILITPHWGRELRREGGEREAYKPSIWYRRTAGIFYDPIYTYSHIQYNIKIHVYISLFIYMFAKKAPYSYIHILL